MAKKEPWLPTTSAEYDTESDYPSIHSFDEYRKHSRYPNITQGYRRTEYGGVEHCEAGEPGSKNWDFVRRW